MVKRTDFSSVADRNIGMVLLSSAASFVMITPVGGRYAPGECLTFGRHFLSGGDGRDGGGGNRAGALCGFCGAAAIEVVGLVLVKRPNQ